MLRMLTEARKLTHALYQEVPLKCGCGWHGPVKEAVPVDKSLTCPQCGSLPCVADYAHPAWELYDCARRLEGLVFSIAEIVRQIDDGNETPPPA